MGRLNNIQEQKATLNWAQNQTFKEVSLGSPPTPTALINAFEYDLRKYFSLCALARNRNAPDLMTNEAASIVFSIRVGLEKIVHKTIGTWLKENKTDISSLINYNFFGFSKKQGLSVRMPLWTCQPTSDCKHACYAHDAMDASPQALIRGAINGYIAFRFENSKLMEQERILNDFIPVINRAVNIAIKESQKLNSGWKRKPRIRFAHVGEITNFPIFANALASQINELSAGRVVCVIYTRHKLANHLNSNLWVINFTLDHGSKERLKWVPYYARVVFSAFNGETSELASINFLEHHRWSHSSPKGNGKICPATNPKSVERTCDGNRCDLCFQKTVSVKE